MVRGIIASNVGLRVSRLCFDGYGIDSSRFTPLNLDTLVPPSTLIGSIRAVVFSPGNKGTH